LQKPRPDGATLAQGRINTETRNKDQVKPGLRQFNGKSARVPSLAPVISAVGPKRLAN
jgi:hypothetical protein